MEMRAPDGLGLRGQGLAAACRRMPAPLLLLALLLLALLLAGCEKPKPAAAPPSPPEVSVVAVTAQEVPIIIELSGTITAVKNVTIIPRVSGFIFERYFTEGTFVEKDAPLYLIDPRPFEEKLARLKAQLEGQQANLVFWKSEEKRYTRLAKQGAASIEKLEGTRSKLSATLADIGETKAQIRNAALDLSYTKINAPFRGRVEQTQINVGNLVQAQKDVLTQLVQLDPIYVEFNMSRAQAFEVQEMRSEGVGFKVDDMVVEILMPDGKPFENKGRMNFISALIDPTTDSISMRGIFENQTRDTEQSVALVPGQFAPVRLTAGRRPGALVVPRTATVETQSGTHVYVVGDGNKVEQRVIETGADYGNLLVVTKGLKEGDKVVVVGVQKVRDGIEVKPTAADAGKAGSAAKTSGS